MVAMLVRKYSCLEYFWQRCADESKGYFSNDPNSDKLLAIQTELEAAKAVLTENIDKLIERQEHIDLLVQKTDQLQSDTMEMRGKTLGLRKKVWWRNMRIWCCICLLLIIIAGILILVLILTRKKSE
eukprot:TRINITY_DN1187_c0_g1_i22.p2 TRINITY_DN1187_c0_g1~~TRINITY_DN1187_c0_g1_i22.p2  ORF type:complete len:127 (+),score=26.35 TRINITY_DN1187_c0_g1_i22:530-910(+)